MLLFNLGWLEEECTDDGYLWCGTPETPSNGCVFTLVLID